MSVISHVETLSQKHARLEAAIQNAYARHFSDAMIHDLKKQKLHIKEELVALDRKLKYAA